MRDTLLGVPRIRTIVFWGLYWVPLVLGNYHFNLGLSLPNQRVAPVHTVFF